MHSVTRQGRGRPPINQAKTVGYIVLSIHTAPNTYLLYLMNCDMTLLIFIVWLCEKGKGLWHFGVHFETNASRSGRWPIVAKWSSLRSGSQSESIWMPVIRLKTNPSCNSPYNSPMADCYSTADYWTRCQGIRWWWTEWNSAATSRPSVKEPALLLSKCWLPIWRHTSTSFDVSVMGAWDGHLSGCSSRSSRTVDFHYETLLNYVFSFGTGKPLWLRWRKSYLIYRTILKY